MNVSNVGHLGDCHWTATMLSKLEGQHVFYVKDEYVAEFTDFLSSLSIEVKPLSQCPPGVPETWIACGAFPQWPYVPHVVGTDIMGYVRRFMNLTANAGHDVLPDAESMLIEFPSIQKNVPVLPFDILVVNASPTSGQAPRYSGSEFDGLLSQLVQKGHKLLATNPTTACPWNNFSFGQIGSLAQKAKIVIGVATGPIWGTFNFWTKGISRYIFLSDFLLDFGPNIPIKHFNSAEEMRVQMVQDNIL